MHLDSYVLYNLVDGVLKCRRTSGRSSAELWDFDSLLFSRGKLCSLSNLEATAGVEIFDLA